MYKKTLYVLGGVLMVVALAGVAGCPEKAPSDQPTTRPAPSEDVPDLPDVPDVDDLGGALEGGSMAGEPGDNCQALCDSLDKQINDLLDERAREIIESAGCVPGPASPGSDPAASGSMFSSNTQYHCPTQSSVEKLGEKSAEAKNNPNAKDRQIDKLKKQREENCPCATVMVQVKQCVVCAGVPPGGLCPTHFVVSVEECNELGGVITVQ